MNIWKPGEITRAIKKCLKSEIVRKLINTKCDECKILKDWSTDF